MCAYVRYGANSTAETTFVPVAATKIYQSISFHAELNNGTDLVTRGTLKFAICAPHLIFYVA